jgi:hypothetical protein
MQRIRFAGCLMPGCGCHDKLAQEMADATGVVFYRGRSIAGKWITSNDREMMIRECPEFVGFVPKQNQDRGLLPPTQEVDPVITVIRVLKYTGRESWVRMTLQSQNAVVKPGEPYIAGENGTISELWRG